MFNFFEIFEEVNFDSSANAYEESDEYLLPFEEFFDDDPKMIAIHLNPNDYAFSYYIPADPETFKINCRSLHSKRPFIGTDVNDSFVFNRILVDQNHEVIQVENLYAGVRKVYKVKSTSPVKFQNEEEFQKFLENIDSLTF